MQFFNPIAILAILIAITIHEASHAWAAKKLGDHTAEDMGRLTLNPLSHIDPMGAIMFLIVGFGWAKPVPVNPYHFRNPIRDNALTALAGPASNLILGFIAFLSLHYLSSVNPHSLPGLIPSGGNGDIGVRFLTEFFRYSVFVNLGLMAFNLLPIAPLDGSKIVEPFVPRALEDAFEVLTRYGPFVLLGVLLVEHALNIPILSLWIFGIADFVLAVFYRIADVTDALIAGVLPFAGGGGGATID